MKELVTYLVKNLADKPEAVSVEETEQGGTLHYKLNVADEDKGKIIGKQGKVIKAIRALVSLAAARQDRRSSIDID